MNYSIIENKSHSQCDTKLVVVQNQENTAIEVKYSSFKNMFEITLVCFIQELIKVGRKIRKPCKIKIFGDSLKHCATGTKSLCVSKI